MSYQVTALSVCDLTSDQPQWFSRDQVDLENSNELEAVNALMQLALPTPPSSPLRAALSLMQLKSASNEYGEDVLNLDA
jgi:hypothetical protein